MVRYRTAQNHSPPIPKRRLQKLQQPRTFRPSLLPQHVKSRERPLPLARCPRGLRLPKRLKARLPEAQETTIGPMHCPIDRLTIYLPVQMFLSLATLSGIPLLNRGITSAEMREILVTTVAAENRATLESPEKHAILGSLVIRERVGQPMLSGLIATVM